MKQDVVIVALNGKAIGTLETTAKGYRFSYFDSYAKNSTNIPLSISYPLDAAGEEYSFGGSLPPYFEHLLPEGWLKDIAEKTHLPMETALEKLATLCRENLGAVEIHGPFAKKNLNETKAEELLKDQRSSLGEEAALFQTGAETSGAYPAWERCVRCFQPLPVLGFNRNFHHHCALEFFGTETTPELAVSEDTLVEIAQNQIKHRESLTGVQPKFSAIFKQNRGALTDAAFIIKPEPTFVRTADGVTYQHSAIAELVTMGFLRYLEMPVAETALVYLQDGQPAVISKRFDRRSGRKIHTEDAAQALAMRHKYSGSYEKIASILKKIPDKKAKEEGLKEFLKMVLLNFIIGNSDSHLKNFSIIHEAPSYHLAPFYDVLPIRMFALKDEEQLGLTVNGKKNHITLNDFIKMTVKFGISAKFIDQYSREIAMNLPYYYESYRWFGIPDELIERLQTYCEERLQDLEVSLPL